MTESYLRMTDNPRMPRVGQAIADRYHIERLIGEGGFGAVYAASDLLAGGRVALKVLDPEKSDHPQFAARFRQEVMVVRNLTHHNTIKIWDVGQTESGCLFMAMELVEGEPLSAVIARDGALPAARTRHIARQVLAALAEAHDRSIIHRDLKPDNVMLRQLPDEADFVKVLDFGIAKTFGELSMVKTQTGLVMCTAAYAAPELLRDKGVTPATDIYAFGLIVVEMLTGRAAVKGDSVADLIAQQIGPEPIPIEPAIALTPLGQWLAPAVAKDPQARYPHARAMLQALNALPAAGGQAPDSTPAASRTGRGALAAPLPTPPAQTPYATDPAQAEAPPRVAPAVSTGPSVPTLASRDEAPSLSAAGRRRSVAMAAGAALVVVAGVAVMLAGPEGGDDGVASDETPATTPAAAPTDAQRLSQHVASLDGRADASGYAVSSIATFGREDLVLARVSDRRTPDSPGRECVLIDTDAFCRGESDLAAVLVDRLGLASHPELLTDAQWVELTAFLSGVPEDAVYRGPVRGPDVASTVIDLVFNVAHPSPELSAALATSARVAVQHMSEVSALSLLAVSTAASTTPGDQEERRSIFHRVRGPFDLDSWSTEPTLDALPLQGSSAPATLTGLIGMVSMERLNPDTTEVELVLLQDAGTEIASGPLCETEPTPGLTSLRAQNVRVSTIALSADARPLLEWLAFCGEGRFIAVEQPADLPAAVRQVVASITERRAPQAPPRVDHDTNGGARVVTLWSEDGGGTLTPHRLSVHRELGVAYQRGPSFRPGELAEIRPQWPAPPLPVDVDVHGRIGPEGDPDHLRVTVSPDVPLILRLSEAEFPAVLSVHRAGELLASEAAGEGVTEVDLVVELETGEYIVAVESQEAGRHGTYRLRQSGSIGHGWGGGSGSGYGRGSGGLGGRESRTADVEAGRADVQGFLDREVIQRVIRRHIGEVRHCYEQGLLGSPDLQGRLTVAFTIGPSGDVTDARVRDTTLSHAEVEGCIVARVRRWVFPAPDGGLVAVSYPFTFQSE